MSKPNGSTTNHEKVISVAVNVPLRRLFEYRLAADYPIPPQVGQRVTVPFGKQTKTGVILAISSFEDYHGDLPVEKLKFITSILDEQSLFGPSLLKLYQWMEKYYHAPPGEIWQTILPSELAKGKPAERSRDSIWQITQQGREALAGNQVAKNAIKQKLTLAKLNENRHGILHSRLADYDIQYTTLKTLAGKNWVLRDFIDALPIAHDQITNLPNNLVLTEQQTKAIQAISQSLEQYQTFLLFGVTASGKTEVYLRLIEQVILQGKQALVLVPEIGLTPQTLKRFKDRFNVNIVVLHSGLTDQQRLQNWLQAKSGDAQIIIGTRSALFSELFSPGIIIIDEEHDQSFRQQQGFRYSARDVAMVRASFENIPVVLGSASPSLESLINVDKNKVRRLDLTEKAQSQTDVKFRIIDLKKQSLINGLSRDLIAGIRHHLDAKSQVLLFLNRRGYAPVLLCHECGWSSLCQRCDIHYTYHHQSHYLQCHHCGSNRKAPTQCPQCQSEQVVPVGLGTERLAEAVTALFPDAKIARIDRDTTRRKSAMNDYVDAIKGGEIDILIGTQMLAKGHHFPNVTLVGLIDMDGALYSADFRAPEYAAQLITQVSGRTGRSSKAGEVIIQTHHSDHPMLSQIIHSGYATFAESAIEERVEAELPPHSFAAMFQAEAPFVDPVKTFLQDTKQILDRYSNLKVELLGPCPALYTKKAGKFRYQLFLQSVNRNQLHQLLSLTMNDIESLASAKKVRWRVEIDPVGDS
ncbi:primosomal protein N' [Aliikangiella marina]|uniref:primosomal protein N' n=1 Tax=Aliikangiella marina TaxID=1712262 RepID=UPI00163D61B2|nr:primosomal protein N' [Aliikangiella marina]